MIRDFNITAEKTHLQNMIPGYKLDNLIKESTCFQSNNPRQIDLILTYQKHVYKFLNSFETGLSDQISYQLFRNQVVSKVHQSQKSFQS